MSSNSKSEIETHASKGLAFKYLKPHLNVKKNSLFNSFTILC